MELDEHSGFVAAHSHAAPHFDGVDGVCCGSQRMPAYWSMLSLVVIDIGTQFLKSSRLTLLAVPISLQNRMYQSDTSCESCPM
jgi:hypothetical protein